MRWSFWLFVLAEFCRRCETKGTWRGVCSGVPSVVQGQSSWGGLRGAPWSCRLFSPGEAGVTKGESKCRYDITGGGWVPQYFLIWSAQISWVAPEDWGFKPPVALPLYDESQLGCRCSLWNRRQDVKLDTMSIVHAEKNKKLLQQNSCFERARCLPKLS